MKTSRKIFGLTYLISVLAVAGIAFFTLSRTNSTLHDLSRQRLGEAVNREARVIYSTLDMVKSDLVVLADKSGPSGDVDDISRNRLSDQFRLLLQKRPAFTRILLRSASRGGSVIVDQTEHGVRAKGAVVQADMDRMADEAGKLWPGNVTLSAVMVRSVKDGADQNARIFYAVTPVTAKDGRVDGALVVAIDFDALVSGFGRPRSDISFFIGDRDGAYLLRPTQPEGSSAALAGESLVRDLNLGNRWLRWSESSDPQLRYEDPDKSMAVVLYRVLLADAQLGPSVPILVVGGSASLAEMDSRILGFRSELLLIALATSGLVALALAWATSYLSRPIQELTDIAERISVGDRDITSPATTRQDEFEILARAMMRMFESLRDAARNEEQAALGRMATMIAHDIRNALSSVKMNLKILHTHHRAQGDALADGCDLALEQVSYTESILTDMLDFARPRSLEPDWIDLDEVLEIASVSMMPALAANKVEICSDGRHPLPKVWGDRTRLIQVFQNLMANAIQAMPDGGCVSVETRFGLHGSKPSVEVSIIDDGPGIPDDIRNKVFQPFFTTRAKGTGLGLTIVRRLVESHDGEIHLASGSAGGTIARVVLPLVAP